MAKSKILISFKIKYVIASCSEDSRTEKMIAIGHSVAEIFYVEVAQNQQLWQQLSCDFYCFLPSPVANMAANYICIKYKSKVFRWKEVSYVIVTWYMVVHTESLKRTDAFG